MQYSKNLKLNLPERSDQYNLDHWNENTNNIDELIYQNQLNISKNQNDISTIFNGLDTKNVNDTNSVFYKLMKLVYPVGSLYWSSNNTNPSQLFGGTWVQIKDKFILAAGDTYTNGTTGGAETVTLTVDQIPSHTHTGPSHSHSFTPLGTITGGEHTHTGPSHSHSFTPSGTVAVSKHTHTLNDHTHSFSSTTTHDHGMIHYHSRGTMEIAGEFSGIPAGDNWAYSGAFASSYKTSSNQNTWGVNNASRVRVVLTASSGWTGRTSRPYNNATDETLKDVTDSKEITMSGTTGTATGNTGETTPTGTFTGTAGTTGDAGTGNTGETTPTMTFTGTAGTTGNAGTGNTGSSGGGSSHNNMPPYVVKYCWERTK